MLIKEKMTNSIAHQRVAIVTAVTGDVKSPTKTTRFIR